MHTFYRSLATIKKMQPGTMGGQSRVATPVSPIMLASQIVTPRSCAALTVVTDTFTGSSTVNVPYPDGNSGDLLYMLVTSNPSVSTPSGWSLVSGIFGDGGVFERRLLSKITGGGRGAESSVDISFGSPADGQVVIINLSAGEPLPAASGAISATDGSEGVDGNWAQTTPLFGVNPDLPGQTLMVPWFETSGSCDAFFSQTEGSTEIDPYINETLDQIPGSESLVKQMVVAVKNPSDVEDLWQNFTVPGSATTRAVFTLRVQQVTCR